MANTKEPQSKLEPLRLTHFGLAQHQFQVHNAEVNSSVSAEMLEDPLFWSHVKHKIRLFDEIRVVAEDGSFMAKVLVTLAQGGRIRTKVIYHVELETQSQVVVENPDYYIKMRGRLGWCVVERATDRNIREGIRSQSEAQRELEEHLRALAA